MAGYRFSTLSERENFYLNEFNIKALKNWLCREPQFYGVDYGTETGILSRPEKKGKLVILRVKNLEELKQKLALIKPEDVYYDTVEYRDPDKVLKTAGFGNPKNWASHELVFDVDSENAKCGCNKKYPGFCKTCFNAAVKAAMEVVGLLKENWAFKKTRLVYSGRGIHIHIQDTKALKLSVEERELIAQRLKNYFIDPWVTTKKRFIRLPYSLHGLISRIAIPLELEQAESFDPENDERVIPKFLILDK